MTPRRTPGRLARLDARLVPRLASAVRAIGRGATRVGSASGPPGRAVARTARRNPTVSTALVAVGAAAILLVATGGDHHHAVAPAPVSAEVALPGNLLGPAPGASISSYLTVAQERRADLAVATAKSVTAIVDFTGYLTAPATESVVAGLPGLAVTRAFARVAPPADGPVHTVTLTPTGDLAVSLTRLAQAEHQVVVNYRKRVAIANATPSAQNEQVVTQYANVARQAKIDAAGLGADAGCVFALEVAGPPAALRRLATRPDVRVLDPVPAGVSLTSLMIVPLEPQVVGTAPVLSFALDNLG
jgi:hypothetical protein